tara:strand:+ start:2551 stop:4683 length:2133 start_codon:yes stop_codon:yes gene_type:complete
MITEEYEYAFMQCNWIQVLKFIQRLIHNIEKFKPEFIEKNLSNPWMSSKEFKDLLITGLSELADFISKEFKIRINLSRTEISDQLYQIDENAIAIFNRHRFTKPLAAESKSSSTTSHENANKGYFHSKQSDGRQYHHKNSRQKTSHKTGTEQHPLREKITLKKNELHQGYLFELITAAEKQDKSLLRHLKNCSTRLTSTPETYQMIDHWLEKARKKSSRCIEIGNIGIKSLKDSVTDGCKEIFKKRKDFLKMVTTRLTRLQEFGDFLKLFDENSYQNIQKKVETYNKRMRMIKLLEKSIVGEHEQESYIGLIRHLKKEVDISLENTYKLIHLHTEKFNWVSECFKDQSQNLEGKSLKGLTYKQLVSELDITKNYISQVLEHDTKERPPAPNTHSLSATSQYLTQQIRLIENSRITEFKKNLTDIFSVIVLSNAQIFSDHKQYNFQLKESINSLISRCNTLLTQLNVVDIYSLSQRSWQLQEKYLDLVKNVTQQIRSIENSRVTEFKNYLTDISNIILLSKAHIFSDRKQYNDGLVQSINSLLISCNNFITQLHVADIHSLGQSSYQLQAEYRDLIQTLVQYVKSREPNIQDTHEKGLPFSDYLKKLYSMEIQSPLQELTEKDAALLKKMLSTNNHEDSPHTPGISCLFSKKQKNIHLSENDLGDSLQISPQDTPAKSASALSSSDLVAWIRQSHSNFSPTSITGPVTFSP